MSAKKVANMTCVYAGRLLSKNGKVYQRFVLPDGESIYFRGVKRVYIGCTYKCSDSSISTKPERVHDVERVENPEWDAAEALVEQHYAVRRAEAKIKAKQTPALNAAIEALRPLVRALPFYQQKALIEYLLVKARSK